MSQENVEFVRALYRRGDPSRLFERLDDDVELSAAFASEWFVPDHPDVIRGRAAVIEFFRHWWGTWDDYVLEPADVIDAGGDRVVVVHHERGSGKGSGVPFERRWAALYTLRGDRVTRLEFFDTLERALESAASR
jgi:ketosteroid isomerase-like protein